MLNTNSRVNNKHEFQKINSCVSSNVIWGKASKLVRKNISSRWYNLPDISEFEQKIARNKIRNWRIYKCKIYIYHLSCSEHKKFVIFHLFYLCLILYSSQVIHIKILKIAFIWWIISKVSFIIFVPSSKSKIPRWKRFPYTPIHLSLAKSIIISLIFNIYCKSLWVTCLKIFLIS